MIIIKSNNYTVECEGFADDYSKRKGVVVTEATDGTLDETYTRSLDCLEVTITKMTKENYQKI